MKLFSILAFLFFAFSGSSQTNHLEAETQKLIGLYQLTDSQAGQVKPLLEKKLVELNSIMSAKGDKKEIINKRNVLLAEYDKKFLAILNDEQKELHKKIKLLNEAAMGKKGNSGAQVNPAMIKGAPTSTNKKVTSK